MRQNGGIIKNNKRNHLLLLGIIITVLAVLSTFRIINLNQAYPNPAIFSHKMGNQIKGGDIALTFYDFQLKSGVAFRQSYPDYNDNVLNKDMTPVRDDQRYVLSVNVNVKNESDKEAKISLVQICAESLSWSNGIDGELYRLVNPTSRDPMRIVLQPYEEKEITLPYTLYALQFSEKDWKDIEQRCFDLVLSYYPVRNIVILK